MTVSACDSGGVLLMGLTCFLVPMCSGNRLCGSTKAYYRQMQIRSADEPMTTFYKCVECGAQWREN